MTSTVEDDQATTAPLRIGDFGRFTAEAFVVDPEVAETRIAREALSPSTSNTFGSKCTAQWAVSKVMPFDDSPASPAGAGSLVHTAFENFYALAPAERISLNLVSEINTIASQAAEGDLATAKYLAAMYQELAFGIFDIEDPTEVEVHRVEEELRAEINGVPVMGRIDRTDVVDGGLVIRDYKTSRREQNTFFGDDYGEAMRTYVMLYEEVYGRRPASAWLYYTKLGTAKEVDVSERALKATASRLKRNWDRHRRQVLDEASFPLKVSVLCGWCPLVDLCPAAAEAGKTVSAKAKMTPYDVTEHNLAHPLDVLAVDAASQALAGEVTAEDFEDPGPAGGDAGHLHSEHRSARGSANPRKSRPAEEDPTMRVNETVPYEKYTRAGDMNPSSWAVNNLFVLRSAAADAVAAAVAEDEIDPEATDTAQLTEDLFRDVTLTVAGAQRDWLGAGPDAQAASFNRLSYVAKDFLRDRACDLTDEDSLNGYLDEMAEAMLAAVESVCEVFNLLDDEAEAIAEEAGEPVDAQGPWNR